MTADDDGSRREVELYVERAHDMLRVAERNLEEGFYASAVNRAYYAILYAASGLLVTRNLARGKHSAVVAGFRQHFIKTGRLADEYSRIYGRVMDDRHTADYEIDAVIEAERAKTDVADARRFVEQVVEYLVKEGWR